MGAKGDGRTDDTAAFERAISRLGTSGGSVSVPKGVYLIDAVQSVRLASGMTLALATGAVLAALPTGSPSYGIVRASGVSGVTIRGGTIRGERNAHLEPMTGEWGMGIDLRGCADITIQDVTAEECWGDGIYLGHSSPEGTPGGECSRATIRRCVLRHNRRQGMSVTGCLGLVVEDSTFEGTEGTPPAAGIDLEPNAGKRVEDVTIRRSTFRSNAGWGLLATRPGVLRVQVTANSFHANGLGGVRLDGAHSAKVEGNMIDVTNGPAVKVEGLGSGNVIGANTVRQNGHLVRGGRLYLETNGAAGTKIDRN